MTPGTVGEDARAKCSRSAAATVVSGPPYSRAGDPCRQPMDHASRARRPGRNADFTGDSPASRFIDWCSRVEGRVACVTARRDTAVSPGWTSIRAPSTQSVRRVADRSCPWNGLLSGDGIPDGPGRLPRAVTSASQATSHRPAVAVDSVARGAGGFYAVPNSVTEIHRQKKLRASWVRGTLCASPSAGRAHLDLSRGRA